MRPFRLIRFAARCLDQLVAGFDRSLGICISQHSCSGSERDDGEFEWLDHISLQIV